MHVSAETVGNSCCDKGIGWHYQEYIEVEIARGDRIDVAGGRLQQIGHQTMPDNVTDEAVVGMVVCGAQIAVRLTGPSVHKKDVGMCIKGMAIRMGSLVHSSTQWGGKETPSCSTKVRYEVNESVKSE